MVSCQAADRGRVLSTQQYEENDDECSEEKQTNAETWGTSICDLQGFLRSAQSLMDMQIHMSIKEESDRVCIRELVPS